MPQERLGPPPLNRPLAVVKVVRIDGHFHPVSARYTACRHSCVYNVLSGLLTSQLIGQSCSDGKLERKRTELMENYDMKSAASPFIDFLITNK